MKIKLRTPKGYIYVNSMDQAREYQRSGGYLIIIEPKDKDDD